MSLKNIPKWRKIIGNLFLPFYIMLYNSFMSSLIRKVYKDGGNTKVFLFFSFKS